jgi:hypothetical protein
MSEIGYDDYRYERLIRLVKERWAERNPGHAKRFERQLRKRYIDHAPGYIVVARGKGKRRCRKRHIDRYGCDLRLMMRG